MRSLPRKAGKEEKIIFSAEAMPKALRFSLIASLVFFLDRVTKIYIMTHYAAGDGFPVIPGIFHVTFVRNTGAAFGMMREHLPVLIVISVGFILFFIFFLLKKIFTPMLWAWALIIAGALGNLYDRLFYGYVVDFLDFRVWPVFNFADSAICIGVAAVCLEGFMRKKN